MDNRFWTTYTDWRCGSGAGTRAVAGRRAGLVIGHPLGRTDYTDPHTGTTAAWDYATWTSPVHRSAVPATEVIASWNADTPAGTWIQIELRGGYSDGTETPWYVMGRWAAGDGDIRRTSVDDQSDGKSSIWTDTFSVDDAASGLRLLSYRLRLTLYRTPGTRLTPTVWRLGAMASDVPDRFTVPAVRPRTRPGAAGAALLPERARGAVPRVRQRRRGVVQSDLVADDHRVLGTQALCGGPLLGQAGAGGPAGVPRGALHVRQPVRGLRELAVQRRLRGDV